MKIKFLTDVTLTVVTGYDEETDNITDESVETFKAGSIHEVDDCGDDTDSAYTDIQFGDGSVAHTVLRSLFQVIED